MLISPQKILKIPSERQKKIINLINKMNNFQGGICREEGFESNLRKIMSKNSSECSFVPLFWDEQFKAATVNNGKQV